MELIYLWVEEYKNIHKQGFNFSPRFSCSYDEVKKELTIDENNDYIENFFGDNINVTAIVGKNGSGKSSLIKLIFLLLYFKVHEDEELSKDYIDLIKQKLGDRKLFLIINQDGYRKISINANTLNCNKKCDEINNEEMNFFSIYFNYILDSWYDNFEDEWVNKIYHKTDNYKTPLLLQPNKQDSNTLSNKIDIDMIVYLNRQRILQFYSSLENNISISSFFKPSTIKMIDTNHTLSYASNGNYVELKKIYKLGQQVLRIAQKNKIGLSHEGDNKILKDLKKLEDENKLRYINTLYITFKVLLSDKSQFDESIYRRIETKFKQMIEDDTLMSEKDCIQESDLDTLIKDTAPEYEVLKIKTCIDFNKNKIFENNDFSKLFNGEKLKLSDTKIKLMLGYIPPWIDIDFFQNDKSIRTLSSGEKSLFTMIVNLMYQFQNINGEKYNTINIFLDETELGLHPEWQKKYTQNILKSLLPLNTKNKTINIYFLTHSPFILSDLPKENVIFLKDGEQDKGVNHKQTFGANIHTLLSDGFFMEDGLMGEFAKKKIDRTIKLLNQGHLSEEELKYCEQIISIIGEPIVKKQLQRMLDSKKISYIAKDTREEIEFLKHRIDLLSKRL